MCLLAVPHGRLVAAAKDKAAAEDGAGGCRLCYCRRQRRRRCRVSVAAARIPFPPSGRAAARRAGLGGPERGVPAGRLARRCVRPGRCCW